MKNIITTSILIALSTNLVLANPSSKYSQYPQANGTTQVEYQANPSIAKVESNKKKSGIGSTLGKVAVGAVAGVGMMALFGLWAANEWSCASRPHQCK